MDYQATYHRSEFAIPALLIIALSMIGAVWLALTRFEGNAFVSATLWILGVSILLIAFVFANCFRVHRWTVAGDGLHIAERPKVPFTGLRRTANLAWAEIGGVHRIESDFGRQIELVTRDGRQFRMPQAMISGVGIDPSAPLGDLLAYIERVAEASGASLGKTTEGLSFWNRLPGLFMQSIFFVISLALAGAAVLMIFDGEIVDGRRSGEGTAIALILPVAAGWRLWKSLRRRREVARLGQATR